MNARLNFSLGMVMLLVTACHEVKPGAFYDPNTETTVKGTAEQIGTRGEFLNGLVASDQGPNSKMSIACLVAWAR